MVYFIGGNFKLAAGKSLDYENLTYYDCSFTISDGIHTSGSYRYELNVGDANEAPSFAQSMYYATFNEGLVSRFYRP